jgi:predicted DNA-binding transcriptional regulator AlpA
VTEGSDFFERSRRDLERDRAHAVTSGGPVAPDPLALLRAVEDLLDALADQLAERLVDRLDAVSQLPSERLVDAREIARTTGRSRAWVYEHAGELGAVRLGSGSRPRLGFSPSRVAAYVQAASEPRAPTPLPIRSQPRRRGRARRTQTGVELLPVKDRES